MIVGLLMRVTEILLALGMLCAAIRMLRGPRAQDRVLALDAFNLDAALLILAFGVSIGHTLYVEAALIIACVGFVSTAALAKFLLRGEVIE